MGTLCSPYWDKAVNDLDVVCCYSILLHCLAGLFWNNPDFIDGSGAKALENVMIAANLVIWILCLVLFAWTFIANQFRGQASRKLSMVVASAVRNLQVELRKYSTEYCDALFANKATDRVYMLHFIAVTDKFLKDKMQETPFWVDPAALEALFLMFKSVSDDPIVDIPSDGGVQKSLVRSPVDTQSLSRGLRLLFLSLPETTLLEGEALAHHLSPVASFTVVSLPVPSYRRAAY